MRFCAPICICLFATFPSAATLLPTNQVVSCGSPCAFLANQSTAVTYNNTLTNGGSSITVAANATASGPMNLQDSVSYSADTGSYYVQMNSLTAFSDTVTISASGLAGTVGYLDMLFTVTGSGTANGQAVPLFNVLDPANTGTLQTSTQYLNSGQDVLLGALTFHFGTPFTLNWQFGAIVYPSAGTTGSSNYTATVDGLEIFTAAGANLTGSAVTVGTSGGETFTVLATPEPASSLLSSLGFAMVLLAVFGPAKGRLTGRP